MRRAPNDCYPLSEVTGAMFVAMFSVLGAILGVFLTIVKLRSAVACDESLLSACQLGAWFDCSSVLTSPWSAMWGIPISIPATAFYLCCLLLAVLVLKNPTEQGPVAGPLLMLLAWLGLAVVVPLAWYAAAVVGSFCTYCVLIYAINLALLLAAWLLSPGTVGAELQRLLAPPKSRRLVTGAITLLLFAASLLVQAALYLRATLAMDVEAQCIKPGGRLPRPALVTLAPEPEAEIALFVDFACPACRAEYTQWRADVAAAAGRYRLSLYHFPREGECLPGGSAFNPNSAYHHACRAARALECFTRVRPDAGWNLADALFAAHDGDGPLFTTTRLVELATAAGLAVDIADPEDAFLACIDRDERILRRIHDHARFALDRGLNETPGAFFVFFHEDGQPFERIPLVKGHKSYRDIDEYVARARDRALETLEAPREAAL
jgi:uncharacterized membrane protein